MPCHRLTAFFLLFACAMAGPAASQQPLQMSLRQVLALGYDIRGTSVVPTDIGHALNEKVNWPNMLVTLQKGTSVAVCYTNLAGFVSLTDQILDNPQSCDVRGADTARYTFHGPAHTGWIGTWRLDERSGEVSFCTFEKPDNTEGRTTCSAKAAAVPASEDAGPFQLIDHHRADDQSVSRVSLSTGAVSICFQSVENNVSSTRCTKGVR